MRVVYELVGIAIARDDDDVLTRPLEQVGKCGYDVVRFVTHGIHHRYAHRLDELPDDFQLLAQRLGRLRPAGLVVVRDGVTKRRLGSVEGDRHARWRMIFEQAREHADEAVDRSRALARCRLHVRVLESEPCPERKGVPI